MFDAPLLGLSRLALRSQLPPTTLCCPHSGSRHDSTRSTLQHHTFTHKNQEKIKGHDARLWCSLRGHRVFMSNIGCSVCNSVMVRSVSPFLRLLCLLAFRSKESYCHICVLMLDYWWKWCHQKYLITVISRLTWLRTTFWFLFGTLDC
jgi:hypothetical protein